MTDVTDMMTSKLMTEKEIATYLPSLVCWVPVVCSLVEAVVRWLRRWIKNGDFRIFPNQSEQMNGHDEMTGNAVSELQDMYFATDSTFLPQSSPSFCPNITKYDYVIAPGLQYWYNLSVGPKKLVENDGMRHVRNRQFRFLPVIKTVIIVHKCLIF